MFGPTVSPQLVQSGKGRIASDPALLYLPRPLMVGAFSVPWQRRTNLWRKATNPARQAKRLREEQWRVSRWCWVGLPDEPAQMEHKRYEIRDLRISVYRFDYYCLGTASKRRPAPFN